MSDPAIGQFRWALAEGYLPRGSTGPAPEMRSHETICLLNTGECEAHVTLRIYFATREPAGPYRITVPPRRTRHVRIDELADPEPVPAATDFATTVESDVPIVVQQTRLDSRQPANALLSTIAYAEPAP